MRQHPRTPCKYAKMSRRGFDGAIKAWRRKLHEFGADKYVSFSKIRSKNDYSSDTHSDAKLATIINMICFY